MNANSIALLKRVLIRDRYSLLQYMHEAWPWTAAGDDDTLKRLQRMIGEEQRSNQRVADWLAKHREVPLTGQFEDFTSLNFVALDRLLPRLVRHQSWGIQELEKDLEAVGDETARSLLLPLLEQKQRHLAELEQLAADHAGSKAVSTIR